MIVKQYRQISIRQHSNFPTYTQLSQIPGQCRGPFLALAEFMPKVRGSKPIAIIFFSSFFEIGSYHSYHAIQPMAVSHWSISLVPCYSTNGRIPLVHITRTMLFNQWPYSIGSLVTMNIQRLATEWRTLWMAPRSKWYQVCRDHSKRTSLVGGKPFDGRLIIASIDSLRAEANENYPYFCSFYKYAFCSQPQPLPLVKLGATYGGYVLCAISLKLKNNF